MATFAEFFAGIGLVREAIEPLGWKCAFANDISHAKAEMYDARFGLRDFVIEDIRRVTAQSLPANIDLATASFPCIDLSLAGNRAGLAGEHSGTIWPFLELLTTRSRQGGPPPAVLLENVTGFLSSHGGRDLAAVCERLAALGYVIDLVVVNARWFTPQSRPRLFVLGMRADAAPAMSARSSGVETRIRTPFAVFKDRTRISRSWICRCPHRHNGHRTGCRPFWRIWRQTTTDGGRMKEPGPCWPTWRHLTGGASRN